MGQLTDSTLTARKIAQCPRLVIGSATYFNAMGVPQTPADLVRHQAVIYDQRGGGAAWTFRRAAAETSVNLQGRLLRSAAEGILLVVFAGMGLLGGFAWMFAPA